MEIEKKKIKLNAKLKSTVREMQNAIDRFISRCDTVEETLSKPENRLIKTSPIKTQRE